MKRVKGGQLSGLNNKSNYYSYYRGKNIENLSNSQEIIINLNILQELILCFNKKENIKMNISNEAIKFLNNSLKEYLKNIIQKLIENNRRRTYSRYFTFNKQNKIISYGINVQRDINPLINAKKNKFFPQKSLSLICTINVDKKLNLLNQYNAIKLNKKYKNEEEDDDDKNNIKKFNDKDSPKKDDGSDSSECDFFQKEQRKSSEDIESNKKQYEGIMNVYQSHELTTNKNIPIKKNKKNRIELKDLIYYLEENQTIPWNKNILYEAYTEMTISGKK
jgi:hypothetical protein